MTNSRQSGTDRARSASVSAMPNFEPTTRALLEAIDDPALIVEHDTVRLANGPARTLFGATVEAHDVRLAIRQPQALEFVLAGKSGDIDFTGVGAVGRPWRLSLRHLGDSTFLIRLIDRSAAYSAEKLRVDFVANASHELRTPLTAVLGYAESLEDGDVEPELARRFAATIRSEARRMLGIIEDLMSLSRIEADRFVAPMDLVKLDSAIHSAVDNIRPPANQVGCAVELKLPDALPPIRGDFPQLVQLFDNLLSNAVRYGCGAKNCKVTVTAATEGEMIRLEVSDTGPGIPRQHLPFLTRRFYRVDDARSRGTGGTGLGLAIVKHIVERHGGELAIDSQIGKGTTVTVLLPVRA